MPIAMPDAERRHHDAPAGRLRAERLRRRRPDPSASTAPTAANATTMPAVMADAMRVLAQEPHAVEDVVPDAREIEPATGRAPAAGSGSPLTITAENTNVPASSSSGERLRVRPEERERAWSAVPSPASTANTAPPSGSVAYVLTSPIEFAFASCRRGTRFGSEASRAGVHSSERHSIANDSR